MRKTLQSRRGRGDILARGPMYSRINCRARGSFPVIGFHCRSAAFTASSRATHVQPTALVYLGSASPALRSSRIVHSVRFAHSLPSRYSWGGARRGSDEEERKQSRDIPTNFHMAASTTDALPKGLEPQTSAIEVGETCKIASSTILRILEGVLVAAKLSQDAPEVEDLISWISLRVEAEDTTDAYLPFSQWRQTINTAFEDEDSLARKIASLSLAISFLRNTSRQNIPVSPAELSLIWQIIHSALNGSALNTPLFRTTQSAQGFLAIPLCSLVKADGTIDELFRFHVWLPHRPEGNPDLAIHSHQPFAQSWILAGEGTDFPYQVEPTTDLAAATHAEYGLVWNDGVKEDKTYKTHQTFSVIKNTGNLVKASPMTPEVHTRDMSYSIPSGAYHISKVPPQSLHATLFYFDSSRGFLKDAPVLGPKDAESFTHKKPTSTVTLDLADKVDAVRSWEILMEQGQLHAQKASWEGSFQAFNKALKLCNVGSEDRFPNAARYRQLVLGELGSTFRRFGRYGVAKDYLEAALKDMEPSHESVEISGELGVVYRHMNLLEDARRAFSLQYNSAKKLNSERAMCRAIGNLGVVNYQLSQQKDPPDSKLLDLAIDELEERVERARELQRNMGNQAADVKTRARWMGVAITWESIGLNRLSLCYTACGDMKRAIDVCVEARRINSDSSDPTVIALSRFFLGRALYLDGQRDAAMAQFNEARPCSPAIALCKEPSEEHRQYLKSLVDAGVDMDLVDDHGYTALDYAVFNGDKETEALVLEGLRQGLGPGAESLIHDRQTGARLRKAYRELFQEKLRPVLLDSSSDDNLKSLRRAYAESLAQDAEKRQLFDGFKFIPYAEFCRFGRLPRWDDHLSQNYKDDEDEADFVIFFSYRWINKEPGAVSPDDEKHTQYRRMIDASEELLRLHPSVAREKLGIWVDFACVQQDNPVSGVSALPMILTQCNAVICLSDAQFHERAWCSVEVLMVQMIKKSYNLHLWYEQKPVEREGKTEWILEEGPMDIEVRMAEKLLTFEEDRSKVLFLERQGKLLG
ncbi:hypothetical protein G7046_g3538 [Stylonectria norvegica]|nr:hypothetical protein G7046_g3538 [Stylonectria norvegica]